MLKSKALGFLPLIIYLTKIQGHLLVLIEISKKFMFISHREHKVTRLNKGIIFDIEFCLSNLPLGLSKF